MMSVVCFFCLIDSPALSFRWLDADEIRFLELRQYARRMQGSHKSTERKNTIRWDVLWVVMTDWKIYLLMLINWSNAVPSKHVAFATSFQNAKIFKDYALKFSMPQIIHNMGYTSATAQLLTIPPYAVGALAAYAFSVFADRYSWRMPFIVRL